MHFYVNRRDESRLIKKNTAHILFYSHFTMEGDTKAHWFCVIDIIMQKALVFALTPNCLVLRLSVA